MHQLKIPLSKILLYNLLYFWPLLSVFGLKTVNLLATIYSMFCFHFNRLRLFEIVLLVTFVFLADLGGGECNGLEEGKVMVWGRGR